MPEDANLIGQEERRKASFRRWLLKVWDWAGDAGHPVAAEAADLLSHFDDEDYPLWGVARKRGLLGDGELADFLRAKFGLPPQHPREREWEREINYSPIIWLDAKTWDRVNDQLGWVNRDYDVDRGQCFWLWSNAANQIRFKRRDT